MGVFDKWFGSRKQDPPDNTAIARLIGELADGLAHGLFEGFREVLLAEPVTYIVPAVWGTGDKGDLDLVQKEMHRMVAPVVRKVHSALDLKGLSPAQDFAVGFIVRSLIVSKLTYLKAAAEVLSREDEAPQKDYALRLQHMEPAGNA